MASQVNVYGYLFDPQVTAILEQEAASAEVLIKTIHWCALDITCGKVTKPDSAAEHLTVADRADGSLIRFREDLVGEGKWDPVRFLEYMRGHILLPLHLAKASAEEVLRWVVRHELGHAIDHFILETLGLQESTDNFIRRAGEALVKQINDRKDTRYLPMLADGATLNGIFGLKNENDPAYIDAFIIGLAVSAHAQARYLAARYPVLGPTRPGEDESPQENAWNEVRAEAIARFLGDPFGIEQVPTLFRDLFRLIEKSSVAQKRLTLDWTNWMRSIALFGTKEARAYAHLVDPGYDEIEASLPAPLREGAPFGSRNQPDISNVPEISRDEQLKQIQEALDGIDQMGVTGGIGMRTPPAQRQLQRFDSADSAHHALIDAILANVLQASELFAEDGQLMLDVAAVIEFSPHWHEMTKHGPAAVSLLADLLMIARPPTYRPTATVGTRGSSPQQLTHDMLGWAKVLLAAHEAASANHATLQPDDDLQLSGTTIKAGVVAGAMIEGLRLGTSDLKRRVEADAELGKNVGTALRIAAALHGLRPELAALNDPADSQREQFLIAIARAEQAPRAATLQRTPTPALDEPTIVANYVLACARVLLDTDDTAYTQQRQLQPEDVTAVTGANIRVGQLARAMLECFDLDTSVLEARIADPELGQDLGTAIRIAAQLERMDGSLDAFTNPNLRRFLQAVGSAEEAARTDTPETTAAAAAPRPIHQASVRFPVHVPAGVSSHPPELVAHDIFAYAGVLLEAAAAAAEEARPLHPDDRSDAFGDTVMLGPVARAMLRCLDLDTSVVEQEFRTHPELGGAIGSALRVAAELEGMDGSLDALRDPSRQDILDAVERAEDPARSAGATADRPDARADGEHRDQNQQPSRGDDERPPGGKGDPGRDGRPGGGRGGSPRPSPAPEAGSPGGAAAAPANPPTVVRTGSGTVTHKDPERGDEHSSGERARTADQLQQAGPADPTVGEDTQQETRTRKRYVDLVHERELPLPEPAARRTPGGHSSRHPNGGTGVPAADRLHPQPERLGRAGRRGAASAHMPAQDATGREDVQHRPGRQAGRVHQPVNAAAEQHGDGPSAPDQPRSAEQAPGADIPAGAAPAAAQASATQHAPVLADEHIAVPSR